MKSTDKLCTILEEVVAAKTIRQMLIHGLADLKSDDGSGLRLTCSTGNTVYLKGISTTHNYGRIAELERTFARKLDALLGEYRKVLEDYITDRLI